MELDTLSLPEDPDIPESHRFYPKSRIRSLFTHDRVLQLLQCSCHQCLTVRKIMFPRAPTYSKLASKIIATENGVRHAHQTYILILAILLCIGCPLLVIGFLQRDCSDLELEENLETFTSDYTRQRFWPKLGEYKPAWSKNFGVKFRWKKYNFVIPTISHDEFSIYSVHTVLPFIEQQRIGKVDPDGTIVSEGAHGTTYAFRILGEYDALSVSMNDLPWDPPKS